MTAKQIAGEAPEPKLRRTGWPKWTWPFAYLLLYLVLWPVVRICEWFGLWPRAMARGFERMLSQFEGYTPNEHDVLVCSYFKTGTNWTMQIATQIAHRGRVEFEHIHDIVPWLEIPEDSRFAVPVVDRLWQESPTSLRVIKTHLPMSRLTYTPEAKYIWVVRDPKDVFVSSYHFVRSIMMGPLMPSVARWFKLYLSKDTFHGSWAEHLQGGWEARHRDNVLFLTFEEMKQDLPKTVKRIAELMAVELTPEEFESVVRQSSYEHMKSIGHKFDTVGLSPPWARPKGAMVRRGKSGGSAELLTSEEQRQIDTYWQAELQRLGCDFPYAEAFKTDKFKAS